MKVFKVKRKGNQIFVNREPETQEEWKKFKYMVEDAIVYAFLTENPCVIYPSTKVDENTDNVI